MIYERWLTRYADAVTLTMVLFIAVYTGTR